MYRKEYQDAYLEAEITKLKAAILKWATERDLWFDSGMRSYVEQIENEPRDTPVILEITSEGPLQNILFGEDSYGEQGNFIEFLNGIGYLKLADASHVMNWCRSASDGVIKDKSSLVTPAAVSKVLQSLRPGIDARIVHSTWGHNMTHNSFSLVIKESKHAALLMSLSNRTVYADPYGQMGTEIPILDESALRNLSVDNVRRVKRVDLGYGRGFGYSDDDALFAQWDGLPADFNYYD